MSTSPSDLRATRELYARMSPAQLAALREDYEVDLGRALTTRKGAKLEGAAVEQLLPLDEQIGRFRWSLSIIDDVQLGLEVRKAAAIESQTMAMLRSVEAESLEVHRDPAAAATSRAWYVGSRDGAQQGRGTDFRAAFEAWAEQHVAAAARKDTPADG